MRDLTTLQELKSIDPSHRYFMGAITGRIFVDIDEIDMAIHDPFTSECGRFVCTPSVYGIPMKAALVMMRHNMELGEYAGESEEEIEA